MCDMCIVLPFAGIIIAVFFSISTFDIDNVIIKDIFHNWKKTPIHILQDSFAKRCLDMGMTDLISYEWPGTEMGCLCKNKTKLSIGKCLDVQHRQYCKSVERVRPYTANKWKGQYLCSSSMKSLDFFNLTKIKANDFCAYKTKKCGKIDTLNNYLCVPENENCPINEISVISNEANSFELKTTNKNTDGIIYTSFMIAEEKVCVNHYQKLFQEKAFPLFNNSLLSCNDIKNNNTIITKDPHYKLLDFYDKSSFYEHNGIYYHIKHLPLYPKILSTIGLYGSIYIGWKKECEKREFYSYMNNASNADIEIRDIVKVNSENQLKLFIYTIGMICLIILGVGLLKYKLILSSGNKVVITSSIMVIVCGIYLAIGVISSFLIKIAQNNLNTIAKAKLSHAFYDMIIKNNCSDDKTNFILNHIGEEFFTYSNRYFNIKILSIFIIGVCLMNIFYCVFAKRSYDRKQAKKQKNFTFYQFE